MTDLLVYQNDNGITVYELGKNEAPDEKLIALVKEHEDQPCTVNAFLMYQHNDNWYADPVWHPDLDQEMDFEERNLGHPGHPHEYGDS